VGPQLSLYVNQQAFEGLPNEYKAIIESASAYVHIDLQAKYDARNMPALKTLLSQGIKLSSFNKDIVNAAFKASNSVYAELNDTNPAWKKIFADYSSFRKESNRWFSVAEGPMDRFMQEQKF
jgi:TRAP-type mannitol/chloroaromatic compound transport system substrate-binding protein